MYTNMIQPTTTEGDEQQFVQGLLQMSNSPIFEGTYWIDYESILALIQTLPNSNELAFPMFEKRMSTEILRASGSFVQLQSNHDMFRFWNTQAVIRLCNHYAFHVGDVAENVMIQRMITQNFYTPIFEPQRMMVPMMPTIPAVPFIMPQMAGPMQSVLQQPQHIPQMQQQLPGPQMMPVKGNEPRKLFVVNFPSSWDSNAMSRVFGQFGEVSRCKVCGTFAFVTMSRREDAHNARMALNGASFEEGSALTVTVANGNTSRNSKVFLQNIPLNWTKDDISNIVRVYGEVIGCHLIHEKKYMNTKCAIVRFIDDDGARLCIEQLGKTPVADPYNPNIFVEMHAEYAIYDKRAISTKQNQHQPMPPQVQKKPQAVVVQTQKQPTQWESKPLNPQEPRSEERMREFLYEKKMLTLFETPMSLSH